jgi:hypothetical protein
VSHVRREPFLQPQVVEPPHGHVVTEPLVGHFVENRRLPAKQLRLRGTLAIDEALLVVEHRAGMLHATKRKGGRQQKVVLAKRIWHTKPVAKPTERQRVGRNQRIGLGLLRARRADEHSHRRRRRSRRQRTKSRHDGVRSRRKRNQVRADRPRLGEVMRDRRRGAVGVHGGTVRQHAPGTRRRHLQCHARLEIRLVKAGKEQVGIRRHEQGVEIVLAISCIARPDDAGARRRDR